MVYSTVLNAASCITPASDGVSDSELEPGCVISNLPKIWLDSPYPVVVSITDGQHSVEYTLETFLSKAYRIKNGRVRIGGHRMLLTGLTISIGMKILLENLNDMTETELD